MTNTSEELASAEESIQTNRVQKSQTRTAAHMANPEIRQQLLDYVTEKKITRSELGSRIGVHATQVTKYLNDNSDFFVSALEQKALDFLRHADERERYRQTIFPTSVTRKVNAVIESMRKAEQFGLIHGAAGWGKTSGVKLYLAANALAVGLTLYKWDGGASQQSRLLWEASGSGITKYGQRRIDWLLKYFTGSERPILVDNAHRLTLGGLQFWFDFRDATGVPIIFIGNPEIVGKIQRNDQMFSRLGPHEVVGLKEDEYEPVAEKLIGQTLKADVPELTELAVETIRRKGHLRALWNHLTTAREIRQARPDVDWRTAFKAAGTKMVREEDNEISAGKRRA